MTGETRNVGYIRLTDDDINIGYKCDVCGKNSMDIYTSLVTDKVYCAACWEKNPPPTLAEELQAIKAQLAALESKVTGL